MYSTIILDCQTRTATPNCEDCIAFKECSARKNMAVIEALH
jgi:hypothetical protein